MNKSWFLPVSHPFKDKMATPFQVSATQSVVHSPASPQSLLEMLIIRPLNRPAGSWGWIPGICVLTCPLEWFWYKLTFENNCSTPMHFFFLFASLSLYSFSAVLTPVLPMNHQTYAWSWGQIWKSKDLPQILEVAGWVPQSSKNHLGHSNS